MSPWGYQRLHTALRGGIAPAQSAGEMRPIQDFDFGNIKSKRLYYSVSDIWFQLNHFKNHKFVVIRKPYTSAEVMIKQEKNYELTRHRSSRDRKPANK
jgi:hypothetical protein